MMDILFEIILEIYGELMFLIVPEKNRAKKSVILATKVFAVFCFFGVIALAIWGVVLVSEKGDLWGYLPIAIAILISLAQIIAGIVLFRKNHMDPKEEKSENN